MRVAKIKTNSTAEVKNHYSDVIYFQGCHQFCRFCFNKNMWDSEGGEEMTVMEIISKLSHFSDVVVLTGGEPLLQRDLELLIDQLRRRTNVQIVLETSLIDQRLFPKVDKILYSFKTSQKYPHVQDLLDAYDNLDIVVVIGHRWFNIDNFRILLKATKKEVYVRYCDDKPRDIKKVIHALKEYKKPFKVFDQLVI
jgi:organic radical activating enzyme